ncbi:MAG TPA: TonB-dependent receptor [Phenylobacterium sp.]|uniref:TonB-dependent receptor n=1 Tax=Phenylobacterium sp. TaxID=1871053 RepID=UPI002B45F313|nr:TonB-dependent receptor [Phenylobacterium sp.]HKR89693.1 TonB-dependent receptor [Phenylobacterium sp.]
MRKHSVQPARGPDHRGIDSRRLRRGCRRMGLLGVSALTSVLAAGAAQAADGPAARAATAVAANAAAEEAPAEMGEVLVTARHRSEDAQKVPAALSVIGGDFLEKTNTTNIAQVAQLVPSIQFTFFNARNANINIRGLGNNVGLANDGLDPGVGFYVDGVYYSRPATATLDLVDIDRIEVLRGPQGTLFGKDTTAGAINITTAAPTFRPSAVAEVSGGDYGYFQAKGSVSGPIVADKLAGRLSLATTTRDGFLTNLVDGEKVNNYRNFTARGQLLFTPTDDLKIRFIADYGNQFTHCCINVLSGIVTPPNGKNFTAFAQHFGYTPLVDPFSRNANANSPFRARQEQGGASVQVDYSTPKAVFTSITAWRFWNWWPQNDADNSPLSILTVGQNGDYQNQYSQEFRVASAGENRVDYVAGLYLYREQIKAVGAQQYGDAASYFLLSPALPALVANGVRGDYVSNYNTDSLALFGQAVWHITPDINLTGGLRYTDDFKRGNYTQVVTGGVPLTGPLASLAGPRAALASNGHFNVKDQKNNLSGLVNLSWQATPNVLAYANYARGYKSGGLNLTQLPAGASPVVAPESIDSVEVGVKTKLFDRRLVLNADVFWEQDKDYQANILDPILLKMYLANVPKVRAQGVEVDIQAQPTEHVSLYASATYNDAIYDKYPSAPCGLEHANLSACNLNNSALAGTPRWAIAAGGEVSYPVSLGAREAEAYLGADYTYRSSIYSAATDSIYSRLPQLSLLNARAGVRSERWDAYVWAKNLFDKDYLTTVAPGSGNTGSLYSQLGDPRTYGVTLRVKY